MPDPATYELIDSVAVLTIQRAAVQAPLGPRHARRSPSIAAVLAGLNG